MKGFVTIAACWAALSLGLAFAACSSTSETTGSDATGSGSGGAGQGGGASSSGSVGSGGSGGAFVDCPESPATNISLGECDLLNPDCPSGKACLPVLPIGSTKMTTKCVAWTGVKGIGAACGVNEECAAGMFCAANYCSPPCCKVPGMSSCDCSINQSGFPDPKASLWVCNFLPKCELFTADACATHPGSQCHLQNINEDLATCAPPSQNQMPPMEGKDCTFINDCEANQMCRNNVCKYNCTIGAPAGTPKGLGGCDAPATCKEIAPGHTIGVCE